MVTKTVLQREQAQWQWVDYSPCHWQMLQYMLSIPVSNPRRWGWGELPGTVAPSWHEVPFLAAVLRFGDGMNILVSRLTP